MKKKLLSIVLALCLIIPCMLSLTACGGGNLKTLDISVNPELSFVVNGNKVVNVMFENDDAGTIYANVDFAGMNVESAIKVVIEKSVISGHFSLTGNEEVEIEVAGAVDADVEKLKDLAKAKVEEVCNTLGVQVTVNAEALKAEARKAVLVEKAKLLAPEYSQAELEDMSEKQLLEIIKNKQNEFKGLVYSQIEEVKEAYNDTENAMLAQIENIRANLNEQLDLLEAEEARLEQASEMLKEQIQSLINSYKTQLNNFKTQLNSAIATYLNAKEQAINAAKAQYETLKTELVNAYKSEVQAANAGFVSYLDAKLANNDITQEQYDYWVNLANSNK